jgi:hypothetical protein
MKNLLVLLVALCLAVPALAQDEDRLLDDSWEDLGEAEVAGDAGAPTENEELEGATDEQKQWAQADAPSDEHAVTMNLVSAGTSAGLLSFVGTGVGVAAAISLGGLLSLAPSPPAIVLWLGFIGFPLAGTVGGAIAGALPFNEPAYLAVTAGAALAGAGLGTLIGWGVGAAAALTAPPRPFPSESEHTFKTLAGIFGGMAVGAGVGAAVAAPFMAAKPWEETGEPGGAEATSAGD